MPIYTKKAEPVDEALEIVAGIRDTWKEAMLEVKKTSLRK